MIEAHFHRCDAYHLAAISDGLRIVEARLATGRADAIEASGAAIDRIANVRAISEFHSDEARFLVPVAGRERTAACIEHIEHGALGLGVHFGEIQVHNLLEIEVHRISQKCDDIRSKRDDAWKVFVLSQRALEARRIEVELVGSRAMQPLDANPLGGNPSDADREPSGAKRAHPHPKGKVQWTNPRAGCNKPDGSRA